MSDVGKQYGEQLAEATIGVVGGKVSPKIMSNVVNSKLFNINYGWGIKRGNFEFLYQEPNVKGGTFISYESTTSKWRISWDTAHSFRFHKGFGAEGRWHRDFLVIRPK